MVAIGKILVAVLLVVAVFAQTNKKGFGCSDTKRCSGATLNALGVGWWYNWNSVPDVNTSVTYIPMCFSARRVPGIPAGNSVLLGFNEPDNSNQANMTVAEASNLWPSLTPLTAKIVSPAMSGNPSTSGSWLEQFRDNGLKFDAVAVHWYKGANATKFISDITAIYNKFNKPIWVTEFAPQTTSSAALDPFKYSQANVTSFINTVVSWMNNQSFVAAYAWHTSNNGTSLLHNTDGTLT